MKFYMKLGICLAITGAQCALVAGTIFIWANVLHEFGWPYYLIFLTYFSVTTLAITGALILIAPWSKEYEKKIKAGYSEGISFRIASSNVRRCPPKWLLQFLRKKPATM